MIGDDSMYGFVIILNSGYTYDITEYAWPASLSVRFRHEAECQSDQTVYYLRTREMPYGQSLGLIWERRNPIMCHFEGQKINLFMKWRIFAMRLIKKKLLLLLIAVFAVSTAAACGQRNPGPSEAGTSLPNNTAQTEEGQAGPADDSLKETRENLEQCFQLLGRDDAGAAAFFDGGTENIAGDGETLIGRIYSVDLFGETTQPSTMYDENGLVFMVNISMGNPDAGVYAEQLRELYGEPAEKHGTPSEGGTTWEQWDMDGIQLRLFQDYELATIEITCMPDENP